MDIRIGVVGEIVAGDQTGSFVKVVDDEVSTGGFLVLTARSSQMTDAFDDWVKDSSALKQYFVETGWTVHWFADNENAQN